MRRIQRSIDKVSEDRFTPAQPTPEVTDHLIDLANHSRLEEFAKFLVDLPAEALSHEMLIQILPRDKRDIVHDLKANHQDLQLEKENQISNTEFDAAAATRDRQLEIFNDIRKHLHNIQLYVTPTVIDMSLQSLGWSPET